MFLRGKVLLSTLVVCLSFAVSFENLLRRRAGSENKYFPSLIAALIK